MSRRFVRPPVVHRSVPAGVALVLALVVGVGAPGSPAWADSVRDDSWQVKALELAELHKITQGEGVTVAVIDTGVDASHPDLEGNVLPGVDLYDEKTKGHIDRKGHGTGMASLIAGHGHGQGNRDGVLGVAPKAKILPITVQPPKPGLIPPKSIAIGIDWAVDHGADVINVSMSSSSDTDIERAVARAWQKNVIVVASAGNRSQSILVGYPAHLPKTMAVTGSDRDGKLGPESLRGVDDTIDIAAPSVDLVQAGLDGGYVTATGVSGATALVSGAVALVRAKYPNLTSNQVFERLLWTTEDAGDPGKDPDFGWGVLDLRRALTGEPDNRDQRQASPSADVAAPVVPSEAQDDELAWLYAILGWLVILVVLALVVLLVRMLVRRRARRRAALTSTGGIAPASPSGAVPSFGPPSQQHGSASPYPPAPPADETVWQRPPGQGGPPPAG